MKAQFNLLTLVGADREVTFRPGLNVIYGPISSGKSSLIRLARGLLGASFDNLSAEVKETVTSVSGRVTLGDAEFSIVRPRVGTTTAIVDVAGENEALRLPCSEAVPGYPETYRDWLLEELGLPRMQVPRARTDAESPPTPVTINDYMLFCYLSQDDIGSSVFGHHEQFRNIKRKYVFEILYGRYNVAMAQLQEELRAVEQSIRRNRDREANLRSVLEGTAWENRAELERERTEARDELARLGGESRSFAATAATYPEVQSLTQAVRALDTQLGELRNEIEREEASVKQLLALRAQLNVQTQRLTKSIVAGDILVDFDFIVCPRCGASIDEHRGSDQVCSLCLQPPRSALTRDDLVREQSRVGSQIAETDDLVAARQQHVEAMRRELNELATERTVKTSELEFRSQAFVSDSASEIESRAETRARLEEKVARVEDYLQLFERMDRLGQEMASLEAQRDDISRRLTQEVDKDGQFSQRVAQLEANFQRALSEIGMPDWLEADKAFIDRTTYLPSIGDRRFDDLSSPGLKVLVNTAHALAHHQTAMQLGLPLPQVLILDGISSHLGSEGYDIERFAAAFKYIRKVLSDLDEELQVIVGTNTLPEGFTQEVTIHLSQEDRLIPREALDRARAQSSASSDS